MAVKMLGRSDTNNAAASDLDALLVLATNGDANATEALDSYPQTDGRTVASLAAYMANNAVFNVKDFGAVGDGVADDAAAIQAAADIAAGAAGLLVFPAGTYLVNSGVSFRCCVWGPGAIVRTTAASIIAITVGSVTESTRKLWAVLPQIEQAMKTWGGSDTGVRIVNVYESEIHVTAVQNFSVGLLVDARNGQLCSYNNIHIGTLYNNKVNEKFDADATSVPNENNLYGGRHHHDSSEGVDVAGARHILIEATTLTINSNRWYGPSLEGDTPEYHLDCAGATNAFFFARWEAATPKVRWNGAAAGANVVFYGVNVQSIVFTLVGSPVRNHVYTRDSFSLQGSGGANGVMRLQNTSSSAYPVLITQAAGTDPYSPTIETEYGVLISHNTLQCKATADAFPRLELTAPTGKIKLGNGTVAPVEAWTAYGADGIHSPALKIAFRGSAAVAKPSVTGSRGGNAALASLLTALALQGLISDDTSA